MWGFASGMEPNIQKHGSIVGLIVRELRGPTFGRRALIKALFPIILNVVIYRGPPVKSPLATYVNF